MLCHSCYLPEKSILSPSTFWKLRTIYRWLSKHNLVIGSSEGAELLGTSKPKNYFKAISPVQAKEGIKNLRNFENRLHFRRKNAKKYTAFLRRNNKYHVDEALEKNHSFLKYPVLVRDKATFERQAEKNKIELGDWFSSPIHPVKTNLNLWGVDTEQIPVAFEISKRILNLPTETKDIDRALEFLKMNLDLII